MDRRSDRERQRRCHCGAPGTLGSEPAGRDRWLHAYGLMVCLVVWITNVEVSVPAAEAVSKIGEERLPGVVSDRALASTLCVRLDARQRKGRRVEARQKQVNRLEPLRSGMAVAVLDEGAECRGELAVLRASRESRIVVIVRSLRANVLALPRASDGQRVGTVLAARR